MEPITYVGAHVTENLAKAHEEELQERSVINIHMSSNKLRALARITKLQEQWQAYVAPHIHSIQYVTMHFIVNRNNVNNYI